MIEVNDNLPLVNVKEKYIYSNYAVDCGLLTGMELATYCVLLRFVSSDSGYAYPTHTQIMDAINVSKKHSIIKYLDSLEEKHFIYRAKGHYGQATRYFFIHPMEITKYQSAEKGQCQKMRVPKKGTLECRFESTKSAVKGHTKRKVKENIKENKHEMKNTKPNHTKENDSQCSLKENKNNPMQSTTSNSNQTGIITNRNDINYNPKLDPYNEEYSDPDYIDGVYVGGSLWN